MEDGRGCPVSRQNWRPIVAEIRKPEHRYGVLTLGTNSGSKSMRHRGLLAPAAKSIREIEVSGQELFFREKVIKKLLYTLVLGQWQVR